MARKPTARSWTKDQYQALLDAAPDALLVVDGTGAIVFANPRAGSMFGYDPEELLGQPIELLVPERLRAEHVALRDAYLRSPRVRPMGVGLTLHGQRKDGTEVPIEISLSPLESRHGTFVATAVRDVSERLAAAERLRAAEQQLDTRRVLGTLLANLPGMSYRCERRRDRPFLFASDGCLELTGHPPSDLLDGRVALGRDLVHPDDREAVWRAIEEAVGRRKPYEVVYRLRCADGRVKHVWERGVGVPDERGIPTALEGYVTDITRRQQAEEDLRRSEQRYEALARLSPVGNFRTDEQGRCVYVNERWCELAGLDAAAALGDGWTAAIHPDDREQVRAEWRESAPRGRPFQCECRFLRPDGSVVYLWGAAVPETDAAGRTTGWIGTVTDITIQKHSAERLRAIELEIQEKGRLADIGAITARLAHDLGNTLAGLLLQVQLIARGVERGDPTPRLQEPTELVIAGVRHLQEIVASFRNFAREQRLQCAPVDLRRLLAEVHEHWRAVGAQRGVELQVRSDRDLPPIQADEPKLRRVLDNLVKNALEAIEAPPGRVTLAAARLGPRGVRVSVLDTGNGVASGVDPFRLFETTKSQGSGLGLSICRQIVQAHGGNIAFEPCVPRGTAFHVELPVDGPQAEEGRADGTRIRA